MSKAAIQKIQRIPQAAITADRLREMAREMLVQADALDALVERPKKRRAPTKLIDPRTGREYGKRI